MCISISVLNRQKCLRIPAKEMKNLCFFLSRMRQLAGRIPPSLTIVLVDNKGMKRLQTDADTHENATDVLCFPYRQVPGETPGEISADIIINAERAIEAGGKTRNGAIREVALYLAHALDHLAGGRDSLPEGRRLMRRRELRWLSNAVKTGVLKVYSGGTNRK